MTRRPDAKHRLMPRVSRRDRLQKRKHSLALCNTRVGHDPDARRFRHQAEDDRHEYVGLVWLLDDAGECHAERFVGFEHASLKACGNFSTSGMCNSIESSRLLGV